MQFLFAPAKALMNRLQFKHKFFVMGGLVFLVLALLLTSLYRSFDSVIQASRAELQGIVVLKPVQQLVQLMQQHRGMAQTVLAGNSAMDAKRADKEKEVSAAVDALDSLLAAPLESGKRWQAIMAVWKAIKTDGPSWRPPESFERHTELVENALALMGDVADHYALSNDPEIASYYLVDTVVNKTPAALEILDQMRAQGAAVLSKKMLGDKQRTQLNALAAGLRAAMHGLSLNLEKTARYNVGASAELGRVSAELLESADGINTIVLEEIVAGIYLMQPDEYFRMSTAAIDKGYKDMNEVLLPTLQTSVEARIASLNRELALGAALTLLMLAALGYFSVSIYQTTVGSIAQVVSTAQILSTGDLRPRIRLTTRDELNLVAGSFNVMADSFVDVLRVVLGDADKLLAASKRMTESSNRIDQSSESQSEAASSMATSVEQMTVGVDQISKNALDAENISGQAGKLSEEGRQIVGSVIKEISQIAEVVNQSANIIDELGVQSSHISDIVNVIKEIADQTNLLALNAAIEAARAGEAGRGFAVVADEVRKLAERTTRSTHEISEKISAIQSGTQGAVNSMRHGVSRVNGGVILARQAGESMSQIQGNAGLVVGSVSEISAALREQSTASNEISRNVERIAHMAEENKLTVADNVITARALESLAENLRLAINRFQIA